MQAVPCLIAWTATVKAIMLESHATASITAGPVQLVQYK